jgi:hypothetical protein
MIGYISVQTNSSPKNAHLPTEWQIIEPEQSKYKKKKLLQETHIKTIRRNLDL